MNRLSLLNLKNRGFILLVSIVLVTILFACSFSIINNKLNSKDSSEIANESKNRPVLSMDSLEEGRYYIYHTSSGVQYALKNDGTSSQFVDRGDELDDNYLWEFTKINSYGNIDRWEIRNVRNPQRHLILSGTSSQNAQVVGDQNSLITITGYGGEIGEVGFTFKNNNNVLDFNGSSKQYFVSLSGQNGTRIKLLRQGDSIEENKVTLHFVDENNHPLDGVTYNGQPLGNTVVIKDNKIMNGDNEIGSFTDELSFTDFEVENYTLSNTHKGTINDIAHPNIHLYPHTIIGNELKWDESENSLKYKLYYTNSDRAGWHWFEVGTEPVRENRYWQYGAFDESGTWQSNVSEDLYTDPQSYPAVLDNDENNCDYYLVYNSNNITIQEHSPEYIELQNFSISNPYHTKELIDNYDGTYDIELGVKGKQEESSYQEHLNVIIVLDTSSSMFRSVKDSSIKLTADDPDSRIYQTKETLRTIAADLLSLNETEPDAVQLELITFNNKAEVKQGWTSDIVRFNQAIDSVELASGTNWAQALKLAKETERDNDLTYVMFLTDGGPSQSWSPDDVHIEEDEGLYYLSGEASYLAARDEARDIILDDMNLYGFFSYGTAYDMQKDYLGSLIDYAYNDNDAKETKRFYTDEGEELQEKFRGILAPIVGKYGYENVSIHDEITDLSFVTFDDGVNDPEPFEYTITIEDHNDISHPYQTRNITLSSKSTNPDLKIDVAPNGEVIIPSITYGTIINGEWKRIETEPVTLEGATYSNGETKEVNWNLTQTNGNKYILENDWNYKVKFKIWPSQETYDLIAALNNQLIDWGDDFNDLDSTDYMEQIYQNNDSYILRTNKDAYLTYDKFTEITYEGEIVKDLDGPRTDPYQEVEGMPLDNMTIKVEKIWDVPDEEQIETDGIDDIDFYILEDNNTDDFNMEDSSTYYMKIRLNHVNNWQQEISISPGILDANSQFKTSGHTYSIIESYSGKEYKFSSSPIHPMLNGLTHAGVTQKEDLVNATSTDGNTSIKELKKEGQEYLFSATNERMGFLKIKKTVLYNGENPVALEDKTILDGTYTFTIYQDEECTTPAQVEGGDPTISIDILNGEPRASDLITLSLGTYWIKETNSTNSGTVLVDEQAVRIDVTPTSTYDDPIIINIKNNYLDLALPITGGMGTIIYKILGLLLIISSIMILKNKKERGKKNEKNRKNNIRYHNSFYHN